MEPSQTTGSGPETVSDVDVTAMLIRIETNLISLEDKLDHLDEQLHGLVRVVEEHRPLLARAAALADPGAKVRAMLHPRRGRTDAVPEDS